MKVMRIHKDVVHEYWDTIKYAVSQSAPPEVDKDSDYFATNVLKNLMEGTMQAWLMYEGKETHGIVVTSVYQEASAGSRNLLVYSVFSSKLISEDGWGDLINSAKVIARMLGCSQIMAYTKEKRLLSVVEKFGGDTSYRVIRLEVGK